jgi:hypothetical protein
VSILYLLTNLRLSVDLMWLYISSYRFVDEMKVVLQEPNAKVLMFTNTKAKADNLAFKLKKALR